MLIYKNDIGENIPADTEACYETVACQEELYREETEEELRAILIFADPPASEDTHEKLDDAVEELITGDSDDPPLSEEVVAEMLRIN